MKPLALVGVFCCLASLSTRRAIAAETAEIVAWGDDFYGQTEIPHSLSNVIAVAAGALEPVPVAPSCRANTSAPSNVRARSTQPIR